MLNFTLPIVEAAEKIATRTSSVNDVLLCLRQLPIDDFGLLLLELPNQHYPGLTKLLPRMASADVQNSWTGSNGHTLLRQSLAFVRTVSQNFVTITGRPLEGHKSLDFGCGWGRIIRLMYYFTDPDRLFGCDPWDRSIEICRADGILGHLAISDYLPKQLPFSESGFDLALAFSVFTHLSERAAKTALDVLTEALSDTGVLVITIRPVEYWQYHAGLSAKEISSLEEAHARRGFAFRPHNRAPVDGDVTYGDTSVSLDYLANTFPRLKLRKLERSLDDPYQLVLFLTK